MVENLNYSPKIIGGRAYMLLNRLIGPDPENPNTPFIDGARFADDMYALKAQGYPITVKINTPGGRIDHGFNIAEAVEATEADTHVYGMAASMGGMIAMKGKNRTADSHASIMLHSPHNPKTGKVSSMIEAVRAQFSTLITALTKIPADISKKLMEGGDYWFNAANAKEYGLIDSVIPSAVKFTAPLNASISEIYAAMSEAIKEDETPKENNIMKSIFATIFGKATDEEAQVSALQLQAELSQLKAKDAAKDAEIAALKATAAQAELKTKAVALIGDAKKAGKFINLKPEDEAKLIESAVANYDAMKVVIDNTATIKQTSAAAVQTEGGKEVTLTYAWLAKNDPDKLRAIAETDEKLFAKLADEYNEAQKSK